MPLVKFDTIRQAFYSIVHRDVSSKSLTMLYGLYGSFYVDDKMEIFYSLRGPRNSLATNMVTYERTYQGLGFLLTLTFPEQKLILVRVRA